MLETVRGAMQEGGWDTIILNKTLYILEDNRIKKDFWSGGILYKADTTSYAWINLSDMTIREIDKWLSF